MVSWRASLSCLLSFNETSACWSERSRLARRFCSSSRWLLHVFGVSALRPEGACFPALAFTHAGQTWGREVSGELCLPVAGTARRL
jgi:hypothetical protein